MVKLRARKPHGLAIPAIIATANLPKETLVAITANETVDKAGAGAAVIGSISKSAREAGGQGTVETRFSARIEIEGSGVTAAGDWLMMAAPDGDGNQRMKKWTSGVDAPELRTGICFKGGADGATIQALIF